MNRARQRRLKTRFPELQTDGIQYRSTLQALRQLKEAGLALRQFLLRQIGDAGLALRQLKEAGLNSRQLFDATFNSRAVNSAYRNSLYKIL